MTVDFVRDGPPNGSSCAKPRYRQTHLAEFFYGLMKRLETYEDILEWNKAQTWKQKEADQ